MSNSDTMFYVAYCIKCGSVKRLDLADPSVKEKAEVWVQCTGNCESRQTHRVKALKEVAEQ